MNPVNVQWLTKDETFWEVDWLRYLLGDVSDYIDIEFEQTKIRTDKNTVLIANHAVNYRPILERLRQNSKRYVIVLTSDENLIEPCEWLHDPACVGLLRNYFNPLQFTHPKIKTFGLGYKRDFQKYLKNTGVERDLIWSFAGTLHGERQKMLDTFAELRPNETHSCSGFGAADALDTQDYVNMLQESRYALCPPGQDSMDSFRLYEALEAGCVPVALRSTERMNIQPSYWHAVFLGETDLPFIIGNTWAECFEIVEQVEKQGEWPTLQKLCNGFWEHWKTRWRNEFTAMCQKLAV